MTTIRSTDLEGETKEKLDSHLKASDFFDVENHPTAMVDVFGATRAPGSPHDTYQFDAQMTILDVSNSLDFV